MIPQSIRLVEDARTIFRHLCENGKGRILGSVAAGWFLSIGVRYIYPSILPFLQSEFGFDLTAAGLLLTALWAGYALGQFPGGILGDVIGEGNILVVSTALSTVAVLTVAVSVNTYMLFIGTVVFGLATSLYGPTRFTIFTDIYGDRAGTAVGLSHAAGSIGNTTLPAMAAAIASYATWRLGYGILLPAFVGVTAAIWLTVPARTSEGTGTNVRVFKIPLRRIRSAVARGGIPGVVAIQILLAFVSQGFLGFYPTYLVEIKGFSPRTAALLFGLYFAVGIVVQPLTGLSNDRFGPRATLAVLIGSFFAGLLALYFARTAVHVLLVTVLVSHRNGTGIVTNTYIANALFEDVKGSGLGLLRTCWMLIGALSPAFVGYVGDRGLMTVAFLVLAGLAGVAAILVLFVREPSS